MPQQILQVDQAMLETTLDRVVRKTVEETLDAMLDAEADEITGAARYERSAGRKAYRAGHYERDPSVKAGRMSLKVPKLKGAIFSWAVIARYRRREESVEEALIAGEGRGHGMESRKLREACFASMFVRQVRQCFSAVWADGFPRCRHRFPVM